MELVPSAVNSPRNSIELAPNSVFVNSFTRARARGREYCGSPREGGLQLEALALALASALFRALALALCLMLPGLSVGAG